MFGQNNNDEPRSVSTCTSASNNEQHLGRHSISPTTTELVRRNPRYLPKISSPPAADHRVYENLAGFLGKNKPSEEVYELKSAVMQEIKNMDSKSFYKFISSLDKVNCSGDFVTDQQKVDGVPKMKGKIYVTYVKQTIIIKSKRDCATSSPSVCPATELDCSERDVRALNSQVPPQDAGYLTTCEVNQQRCQRQWDKASSVPPNIEEFSLDEVCLCFNLLGLGK